MTYKFEFTDYSFKQFKSLPEVFQKRIKKKLIFWQNLKQPFLCAKSLKNFGIASHRFRIGDYRIICCIEKETKIIILKVGHRKNIYK